MSGQSDIICDVSKSNLVTSDIQLSIIKLFNKIKINCCKANPAACDEIIAHFSYCIKLFNDNKIDSIELVNSVKTLLGRGHSDLYYEFLNILQRIRMTANNFQDKNKVLRCTTLKHSFNSGIRKDVDFMNLSDCGTSYRLLPTDYKHSLCSGRISNKICNEVLNNNYICFPSMTSEDSSVVSSKKNFHEEQMHRLEDERYEVDMYLEINKYAMKYLSKLQKVIDSMTKEDKSKFVLDDFLGSTSAILMRKAIYRIYGDASDNMIEGLKARPKMAIPLVLSRMQEKAKDWSQFHTKFKMAWQERANKLYLPSLDYQGDVSKKDALYLKRSTFVSQLSSLSRTFLPTNIDFFEKDFISLLVNTKNDHSYDPLIHTQVLHKAIFGNISELNYNDGNEIGPHITLLFPADNEMYIYNFGISIKDIIDNANSLIVNQVNLQSSLSKEDKQCLNDFIYHVIGYFFDCSGAKIPNYIAGSSRQQRQRRTEYQMASPTDRRNKYKKTHTNDSDETVEKKLRLSSPSSPQKVSKVDSEVSSKHLKYKLMLGNSYIYMFLRLYHILIDRLTVLKIHGSNSSLEEPDNDEEHDDNSMEENEKYSKVLQMLLDCTESSSDSISTNDNKIKALFTTKAFIWLTIPRIVQQIVKTSQQIMCAGLEYSKDMLDYFCQYSSMTPCGTGGTLMNRIKYVKRERKYAVDTINFCLNQNLTSFLMIYLRQEGRLMIQLLDTDDPQSFNDSTSDIESAVYNISNKSIVSKQPSLSRATSNIDRPLSSYEKFIDFPRFTLSVKQSPLFLMRNVKFSVRKLTERILNYKKNESLKRPHPSMEEIMFIEFKNQCCKNETAITDELLIYQMRSSFQEMYKSIFIGNGDIYRSLFDKNYDQGPKVGFLSKTFSFKAGKGAIISTIHKKSLMDVVNSLNKSYE